MSLEEIDSGDELAGGALEGTRGRAETKARKGLSKLGLKKVDGINRVVFRRPKGVLFVVSNPEVFKSPTSDVYIVFGEGRVEEQSQNPFGNTSLLQQEAVDRQAQEQARQAALKSNVEKAAKAKAVEDDDDETPDEEGLTAADIEVVMSQSGASRAKAVKALRNQNGDILQAILDLA
ncbi:nascent polypeptide-associated complex, alpha subunit [Meredithblackwellia eburnea MCA 4105]